MGHLWHRRWSILDVTDPRRPEVVNFIEGPSNTWTIQMVVQDGKMITALEQMPESWGGDPNAPFDEGVLIWDVAEDPVHPDALVLQSEDVLVDTRGNIYLSNKNHGLWILRYTGRRRRRGRS